MTISHVDIHDESMTEPEGWLLRLSESRVHSVYRKYTDAGEVVSLVLEFDSGLRLVIIGNIVVKHLR